MISISALLFLPLITIYAFTVVINAYPLWARVDSGLIQAEQKQYINSDIYRTMQDQYNNKHILDWQSFSPYSACTDGCSQIKRLVCGTNGVTYFNPCMLKCAAALNPKIKMKHEGPC